MTIAHEALRVMHLVNRLQTPSLLTGDGEALVFRGTTTVRDLLFDVDAREEPFHGLFVHRGFVEMYRSYRSDEAAAATPSLLGGYSCGGALAILDAVDRAARGAPPVPRVVAIASPRFVRGDSLPLLSRYLSASRVTRVLNPRDLVPRIPTHLCHYANEVVLLTPEEERGSALYEHSGTAYTRGLLRYGSRLPRRG